MESIELIIRTVGVTASVILSVNLARTPDAPIVGRICGALLCLGVAAYMPCSTGMCSKPIGTPAVLLAAGVPFFFWGWTRSIMDDHFRLTPLPIVGAIALATLPLVTGAVWQSSWSRWGVTLHSIIGIAFVIAALFEVLRTWREDLIEARRRLRLIVLVVTGTYSITVLTVELFLQNRPASDTLQLINATLLSLLLLILAASLLGLSIGLRDSFGWYSAPSATAVSVQPAAVVVRDVEQELIDKLQNAMTEKAMYRDASLTVAVLANVVGVPERRLREVINRRLGHKNFPSYVNAFRLEEVRLRLADARNDHLPILTIALEAGFGSIVVFNRLFKECHSLTPTEFRARRT
jgi:AraC-like DNA-binding protein